MTNPRTQLRTRQIAAAIEAYQKWDGSVELWPRVVTAVLSLVPEQPKGVALTVEERVIVERLRSNLGIAFPETSDLVHVRTDAILVLYFLDRLLSTATPPATGQREDMNALMNKPTTDVRAALDREQQDRDNRKAAEEHFAVQVAAQEPRDTYRPFDTDEINSLKGDLLKTAPEGNTWGDTKMNDVLEPPVAPAPGETWPEEWLQAVRDTPGRCVAQLVLDNLAKVGALSSPEVKVSEEWPDREAVARAIYDAEPFPDISESQTLGITLKWEAAPQRARDTTYRRADAVLTLSRPAAVLDRERLWQWLRDRYSTDDADSSSWQSDADALLVEIHSGRMSA